MSNHKKRNNTQNGSQKGKPYSDGLSAGKNVMSKEEMDKAISPTRETMSDG